MADEIPVKLVVEEPELHTKQYFDFAQETIKIGRGRPGKARKGVDVQLTDQSVARVACVIHVRKLDDVFVMDMGSGVTRIGDKKVGARGKLTSGTEMFVGNTRITIYIGEDAENYVVEESQEGAEEPISTLADEGEEEAVVDAHVSYQSLDGAGDLLGDEDLPTNAMSGISAAGDEGESAASIPDAPTLDGAQTPEWAAGGAGGFDASAALPPRTSGSFGLPPESPETPGIPQGYNFYPMHQEPDGVFGPLGPAAHPLPQQWTGPNLQLLLDVSDRLGKELWFEQELFW